MTAAVNDYALQEVVREYNDLSGKHRILANIVEITGDPVATGVVRSMEVRLDALRQYMYPTYY